MKAYIQTDEKGDFYNVNAYIAATGFEALGYEVIKYHHIEDIEDRDREAVTVGGVGNVRKRLEVLGFPSPKEELEYPAELTAYLGRKVWSSTIQDIVDDAAIRPVFIKPKQTKAFSGRVIRDFKDLIGLESNTNLELWCSEVVDLVSEWRCFIRYGEVLDARRYKGAWDTRLDAQFVRDAINDFASAPAAYSLDIGLDSQGKYYLVEVNDGHSLGTYGLGAVSYAKFLSARWAELTGTKDYLHF